MPIFWLISIKTCKLVRMLTNFVFPHQRYLIYHKHNIILVINKTYLWILFTLDGLGYTFTRESLALVSRADYFLTPFVYVN